MDLVQKLYTSLCPGKENLNVKACFRLVKKGQPRGEAPPRKVCIAPGSKEQRRQLLLNSKEIKNLNDDLKEVIVVRDRTIEQRKANKNTYKEKKKREEDGEDVEERFGEVNTSSSPNHSFQE
ncbi:hypothetical protein DPMN_062558 [Dreissena polymorpha]|uniref:Uncharacterized protein n=1 Tax=Dreissena polymorpha TaxID=45954 RepID=A0A9D4HKA2_DREPO|nr:hypothetical protein DPMN_062558 [Dreissena polymorpha]